MRDRFNNRVENLRKEIQNAIVEELSKAGGVFVSPEDLDYSEYVWGTCYDKDGNPYNCYVTKVELCNDDKNELAIYMECEDGEDVIYTYRDCEARVINFLDELFAYIEYHLHIKE